MCTMESAPSLKTRSYLSCSRSGSSFTSAAAAMARAKAEAAKARLMFADEEERIKVEKAKLEAKMDKMVLKRETAAAVAEAEALEAAVDTSVHSKCEPQLETAPADVMQRTSEYVEQMNLHAVAESGSKAEPLPSEETVKPHTELPVTNSVPAARLKSESCLDDAEFKSHAIKERFCSIITIHTRLESSFW